MFVFGLGLTAAMPAKQVLVLRWVAGRADRRKVFAYKFTGEAIGMAIGAYVAGHLVDLSSGDGLDVGFLTAALGFVTSSAIIGSVGARATIHPESGLDATGASPGRPIEALRTIFASPALRWTAVITVTLALGFYAQFEAGLPAYAITVLDVDSTAIGTAAAVNSIIIVLLQVVVVRAIARRSAPTLLMAVGSVWVLAWLILSLAQFRPEIAAALFVTTFGVFAVGRRCTRPCSTR